MKFLDDILVLDMTRILAGPYCTMLLADMGANVIKIEAPNGDESRYNGPFVNGESTYFMSVNRNKRGMVIDLKSDQGKEIFSKLIEKADVLVENFRPGVMEKLGLGYDKLQTVNPQLIYCAISGFGHTGPYKKLAAYDIVVQAMGGTMSLTGQPGGRPTRVGTSIGDIAAGLFGSSAIVTALHGRQRTGKGTFIDISMFDCQVAILENAIARYFCTGVSPEPIGNRHPLITPFDTYKTKDGYIIIAAGSIPLWERLCNILEIPEVLNDPRFMDNPTRTENEEALKEIMESKLVHKTTNEWLQILLGAKIACGPLNKISEVVRDPQILSRNMIVEIKNHPTAGDIKFAGIPIKFSGGEVTIDRPAPLLGQHTEEILKEFGIDTFDN